ncbi:hypothetical protein Q3G72_002156 [Acer saccharum]|nr:hypothetical protein Q3G72_002156 [Acer saccharum]
MLRYQTSEFGLAKRKEEDDTLFSTRVVGTWLYGPGICTMGSPNKANVYSFGVVALEIASGKNNASYRVENGCVCLLDLHGMRDKLNEEGAQSLTSILFCWDVLGLQFAIERKLDGDSGANVGEQVQLGGG